MFRLVVPAAALIIFTNCGMPPAECEPNTRRCEGDLLIGCDDTGHEAATDCMTLNATCVPQLTRCIVATPMIPPDAGQTVDSGTPDAGMPEEDAGTPDAGMLTIDAGMPDAGLVCTGTFPTNTTAPATPPYAGTAYIDADAMQASDPSSFIDLTYTGRGVRTMFDRRTNSYNQVNALLFDARFGISKHVEIQVNPEFSQAVAEQHARFYAHAVGQLPAFLFRDLDTMWIHDGNDLFGGANRNILIHVQQGQYLAMYGWLEEVLLHEATHTSLDSYHLMMPRWLEAMNADRVAISDYARDNPMREDVSETVPVWFFSRFRSQRLEASMLMTIERAVPNRLRYLDCLGFDDAILP
ncbi:MAG: hypothetical protein ACO1OB_24745 [Archangium sp.]